MKICILTTSRSAFASPHYTKEAGSLIQAGHSVVIIAPCPGGRDPSDPVANYLGHRVIPLVVGEAGGRMRKLLRLPSLFRLAIREHCDVYEAMEPASLFVGVALKVATGRRLAYNSREDYPMSLAVNTHLRGLTGLLHAVFARLEAILLLFVDHCFAVTAPMASRLRGRRRPSSLLMNLPLREFGSEISMSRASPSDPFGVIFTGYPTMPVAMSEMIEALALLRGRGHDASLTFLGCPPDHPAALEWLATTARLSLEEWVHLLPEVAPREVACHLAKAHCGSILYRPTGYTRRVVHVVKLYEYMACGLPIVASNFPGLTKTIEAEECGVVADPCSPTAIADALERLILDPEYAARLADNGRRAFLDRFSWEVVGLEYVSVMEGLGLQKKQLQGAGSSPSARP